MKLGNSNSIRLVFTNAWIQKLLLIVFLVTIFWNGLWGGIPRTDQIFYLHQISQFTNLGDILINNPSWNRTQANPGDSILYRPFMYIQLGSFYYFFRYNFFLWQLSSLILHLLVVLGLHSLFIQGILRKTAYPFLLSLLLGSSLLGSECVLWSHISGNLTFSALAVFSVYFLIRYFSTDKWIYAGVTFLLGVISEFFMEYGVVLNVLIAASFLYCWLFKEKRGKDAFPSRKCFYWALAFLVGVLIGPILSILDLWFRGINPEPKLIQINDVGGLLLAVKYTVEQILFWLGGLILPSAYIIQESGRLSFLGFKFSGWLLGISYAVILSFIFAFFELVKAKEILFSRIGREAWLAALGSFLFVCAYSFVIAYGRALPRGLGYVFVMNVYYAYIFYLVVMIGLALFTLDYYQNTDAPGNHPSFINLSDKRELYLKKVVPFLLFILIVLNAFYTFTVATNYRYKYSLHRQKVIDAVEIWLKGDGKAQNAYFRFKENCLGNDSLPMFQEFFRKNSGWTVPVNLADVLYPEKSFRLHQRDKQAQRYDIFEIKCPNE